MTDAPYPVDLAVAVLRQNIGKPGPWSFDEQGAAVVRQALDVVLADATRAESRSTPDREALQAVGRRLKAEYEAIVAGSVKDWRFREYQAVLAALARPASSAGGGLEEDHSAPVLRTSELASGGKPALDHAHVLQYAQELATVAAKKVGCVPEWRPFDDVVGCLTQIDNCLTGLVHDPRLVPGGEKYATPAPAPSIPAGWVVAPVVPTEAMLDQGVAVMEQPGKDSPWHVYAAMLAAAPSPVVEGGDQGSKPDGLQPALGGNPPLDEPESAAGAEWVAVPRHPSHRLIADLSREWAYTIEETAESYQGFLDVVARQGREGSDAGAYERGDWIAAYDDGSEVHLDSYSGGAAPEGAWGKLTLRFIKPGEPDTVRAYAALAERDPSAVAPELGGGKLRSAAEPQNVPAQGVTGGAEPCPACLGEGCGVCNERGAA